MSLAQVMRERKRHTPPLALGRVLYIGVRAAWARIAMCRSVFCLALFPALQRPGPSSCVRVRVGGLGPPHPYLLHLPQVANCLSVSRYLGGMLPPPGRFSILQQVAGSILKKGQDPRLQIYFLVVAATYVCVCTRSLPTI